MRILHIVGTIDPAAGGPTEVIRTLLRFTPEGYVCEVASLDNPAAPFLRELEFPVHALGSAKKRWFVPAFSDWLAANRSRFDAVIVHGLWEYTGLAARRTLRGHIPYAVFSHGMLDPYFKRAYPVKHLKKCVYWLASEYWNLRDAFCVLFTAAIERDLAQHSFAPRKWKPVVVSLGAESPLPDTARNLAEFHTSCPQLVGKRFLLFLGRIAPKKGGDLLLEAFATAAVSDPELHLLMAGPDIGTFGDELRTKAETAGLGDRIHWPGMLLDAKKWGAFAACEAFVLPSHQENFGVAIVEALACGKPVLISNQINIYPEIEADGCGFVEPDTVAGTTRLLTRWLALSPEERNAMGERAQQTFATRYDMRKNAATILRVFETAPESN